MIRLFERAGSAIFSANRTDCYADHLSEVEAGVKIAVETLLSLLISTRKGLR